MRHGITATRKDRLTNGCFRAISRAVPIGGICSKYPPALEVRQITLRIPRLTEQCTLVQITDLHYDPQAGISLENIRQIVDLAASQNADAYMLTGDFIIDTCEEPEAYATVLRRLARKPCFAVFGNHDGGRWASGMGGYPDTALVRGILARADITVLYNESVNIQDRLQVVGLADLWAGGFHPEQAFSRVDADRPVIVLSHNPDTSEPLSRYRWDLMLSGHTHGGQVVLPLLGAPWTPIEQRHLRYGLHDLGDRWINVSSGTGGVFHLRLNCPPEIVVLRLEPVK